MPRAYKGVDVAALVVIHPIHRSSELRAEEPRAAVAAQLFFKAAGEALLGECKEPHSPEELLGSIKGCSVGLQECEVWC